MASDARAPFLDRGPQTARSDCSPRSIIRSLDVNHGVRDRRGSVEMTDPVTEFEGTWEEAQQLSAELSGHRVRVIVLDREPTQPGVRRRIGPSFLECAGSWVGDDLGECLAVR